ncbi:MAG: lytic transglycosylase domain-containing protein, partial [Devosia sp.]|nr:lytic transglycosylase domain-containing protein [Devosia sp.]
MRGRHLISLGLALAIAALSGAVHAVESDAESAKPRSCYAVDPSAPAWTAVCIRQEQFFRDTCGAIQLLAWREQLPVGYFARLIWQESRFDPFALSTAGAQGIAQFIPSTARIRGLRNPFDPSEALAKSAEYLRFLTDKFGNLGLAAVAYNGGEGRASGYIKGIGYLPAETRFYVEIVTGRDPDAWLAEVPPDVDYAIGKDEPFIDACVKMAEAERVPRLDRQPSEWKPWGVLLAQNFS